MNDELEERLGRLRPAEPPRDLMRRLRLAEPQPTWRQRSQMQWARVRGDSLPRRSLACASGVLAVLVWVWVATTDHFSTTSTTIGWRTGHEASNTDPRPRRAPGTDPTAITSPTSGGPFEFSRFGGPDARNDLALSTPVLNGPLPSRPGSNFHLEMPTGPIRLDCGYTLLANPSEDGLFGTFDLNVRE